MIGMIIRIMHVNLQLMFKVLVYNYLFYNESMLSYFFVLDACSVPYTCCKIEVKESRKLYNKYS